MKIHIYGYHFSVELSDDLKVRDLSGEIDFQKLVILINAELAQQAREETLLHEIIEAVAEYGKINFKHDDIYRLSHGLYQIFSSNRMINLSEIVSGTLNKSDTKCPITGTT